MASKIRITRKVYFARPTVGAKHYLTVGASGWTETFPRIDADKQLETYIGQVALAELVDCFVQEMSVDDKSASWSDVLGYLARVFNVKSESIPMTIGVAFWGHVVLAEDAKGKN
jgi:hypothetical protein